jgi:hypothetical protein
MCLRNDKVETPEYCFALRGVAEGEHQRRGKVEWRQTRPYQPAVGRVWFVPDKDRASILNPRDDLTRVLKLKNQVLRRIAVTELHRFIEIGALDDERVSNTLANDVDARKRERLSADLGFDLGQLGGGHVDGEEDDLRVGTVLGLTEEVGCDESRVGELVGDDLRER